MTRALLDVNVLIALLDRAHVHHDRARAWLTSEGTPSWASCAITQNGFLRVVSQRRYANPVTVASASLRLRSACASEVHQFWPCDYSLLDGPVSTRRLLTSRSLTDAYLLGLAVLHGGRLVTFDQNIPVDAVAGASPEHVVTL